MFDSMPSLRHFARCIGLAGEFSVTHDFFGLRSVPRLKALSIRQQMRRLAARHFHFNVILVGSDAFSSTDLDFVNRAVFETREVYSKAGVGVGRVQWFAITVSMAGGQEDVDSRDEAVELTNSWTVHNDGLDVFVVRDGWAEDGQSLNGLSDDGASCDKDAGKSMSGSVISLQSIFTGFVMAHEMGHDLGLDHIVELDIEEIDEATPSQLRNIMFPFTLFRGELNADQVATVLEHCLIQSPC